MTIEIGANLSQSIIAVAIAFAVVFIARRVI